MDLMVKGETVVNLELLANQADPVHKDHQVSRVLKVQMALMEHQVPQASQVHLEVMVVPAILDLLACLVNQVSKDHRDLKASVVLQGKMVLQELLDREDLLVTQDQREKEAPEDLQALTGNKVEWALQDQQVPLAFRDPLAHREFRESQEMMESQELMETLAQEADLVTLVSVDSQD